MRCPFCNFENTRVIDSRPAEENNSIRRRRVCEECGKRFTTYEKIETLPVMIVKKDRICPDAELVKRYEAGYEKYKKIYPAVRKLYKELV